MKESIHEIVQEALEETGLPILVDEDSGVFAIPKPSKRGGVFLVEVVTDEDAQEALFGCGIAAVPDFRRAELLETLNDLNVGLKPFNRFTLAGEVAGVRVGCELAFAEHPKPLIHIALGRILHALDFGAERVLDAVDRGYNPKADAVAEAERLTGGPSAAAE